MTNQTIIPDFMAVNPETLLYVQRRLALTHMNRSNLPETKLNEAHAKRLPLINKLMIHAGYTEDNND